MAGSNPPRATVARIAELSGVSQPVVSAVLGRGHGTVRFSEATRKRVETVARKLGYRPNRTAAVLASGRHHALGLLVNQFGYIHNEVFHQMLTRAAAFGQVLILDAPGDNEHMPVFLREDCVDAVISFEDLPAGLCEGLDAAGLACVQVNTNQRAATGAITFDEEQGMRLALAHLVARGCTRIGLVIEAVPHYSTSLRRNGLRAATADRGLTAPAVLDLHAGIFPSANQTGLCAKVVQFLERHPRLDSLIMGNDRMAPFVYRAARECRRVIPDDLAVIGTNDDVFTAVVSPLLTSLFVDRELLGRTVIDVANRLIEEETSPPVVVPYELKLRESA
jgi:LacI family transcriptional regulator